MLKKQATLTDVKDFRNWLKTEIGKGAVSYNAFDQSNCLVCQYLRARGASHVRFTGETTLFRFDHIDDDGTVVELPKAIAKIAYGMDGTLSVLNSHVELTFVKALERADKIIQKMSA